jgi:cytochrome c-type biogenesis protein CcmF
LNNVIKKSSTDAQVGVDEVQMQIEVHSKEGIVYQANPKVKADGQSSIRMIPDTVRAQNLILNFNGVADNEKNILIVGVKESTSLTNLITLKVFEFPFINILWIGVIVMTLGFGLSTFARAKQIRSKKE